ncbi:hypothetical protein ECG_03230 [Echinococcus granulosus]|uniref:Uncharacterized protein n=1 Tax=Echinococcus granulosus TaxID=6210 RepID=A0A068X0W7_ECHGR|nr:hypothetical protein ECG_03230 [Echinococcus granulosus]CDS24386.1 hypothetical protein EgrG_000149600 [Echinococcus granulosus]
MLNLGIWPDELNRLNDCRVASTASLTGKTNYTQRSWSVPHQRNGSASLIAALNAQSRASPATSARLLHPPPRLTSSLPRLTAHYRGRVNPRNRYRRRSGSRGRSTNYHRYSSRPSFLVPHRLEYVHAPLEPRLQRAVNKRYTKLMADSARRLVSAHQPLEF